MARSLKRSAYLSLALAAAAALSVSACAKKPKPTFATQAPPRADGGQQAPRSDMPTAVTGQPTGPIPGSSQDFVVNVGDRVYFDTDSYDIRDDARPLLDAQTQWLRRFGTVRVRIEGNADERGTREYNLALGARRANAVRDHLVRSGVTSDRISTISFGKEQPIDPGGGDEAWQKNRNGRTAIVDGAR